jgi:putative hydrolase of the HAD superfamily
VGALIDQPDFDTVDLMRVLYATPRPGELVRPEGVELVKRARADGRVVALLTNDLHAFHDDEWVSRMTILEQFDPLIDLSRGAVLKPDPRAFRSAIDRLGLPANEVLFIDDLRGNIAGADDVGLATQWFDVTRPRESFATVAARVGLLD